MGEKLTPRHILHENVEVSSILGKPIKIDLLKRGVYDEGVRDSAEYFILVENMVNLPALDDIFFFHDLDAAIGAVLLFLDQPHPAKRTCIVVLLPYPRIVRYW